MSDKNIDAAVDMVVNSIVQRRASFLSSVTGSANTKTPLCWQEYGYPVNPTFDDFYSMYKRNGYARAGVELIPDKCWKTSPRLVTPSENWNKAFAEFASRVNLWHNLKELDKYQRVGRYGALLLTIADDKNLNEPVEGTITLDAIESVTPYYECQMDPTGEYYTDRKHPKYGLPVYYQLGERSVGTKEGANEPVTVHESRVLIWGEGATGNSIFGTPVLEAGLNALINIEKINGAGGEGFWKNARTPLQLSAESGIDIQQLAESYGVEPKELSDKINEKLKAFNTNLDSAFLLGGMKATPMTVTLPSPGEFLEGNKLEFAASVKIPLTILEGNQSGNQASQENGDTLDEQCESRRENEINNFIIRNLIGWMLEHKSLAPQTEYAVEWDSLLEPSPSERAAVGEQMARINQMALGTGQIYFTTDEVRKQYGLEPLGADDGE